MKSYNLLERLKCIWCILTQKDYIVLTSTVKGDKLSKSAAYVSNNIGRRMLSASTKFTRIILDDFDKFTNKNK